MHKRPAEGHARGHTKDGPDRVSGPRGGCRSHEGGVSEPRRGGVGGVSGGCRGGAGTGASKECGLSQSIALMLIVRLERQAKIAWGLAEQGLRVWPALRPRTRRMAKSQGDLQDRRRAGRVTGQPRPATVRPLWLAAGLHREPQTRRPHELQQEHEQEHDSSACRARIALLVSPAGCRCLVVRLAETLSFSRLRLRLRLRLRPASPSVLFFVPS